MQFKLTKLEQYGVKTFYIRSKVVAADRKRVQLLLRITRH